MQRFGLVLTVVVVTLTGCKSEADKAVEKAAKLVEAKDCDTALKLLDKHLDDLADSAEAHELMGRCKLNQVDNADAAKHYETAIKLGIKPRDPFTFQMNYAHALLGPKRWKDAEAAARRALEAKPPNPDEKAKAEFFVGVACVEQAKMACAKKYLSEYPVGDFPVLLSAFTTMFRPVDSTTGYATDRHLQPLPAELSGRGMITTVDLEKLVAKRRLIDAGAYPEGADKAMEVWEKPMLLLADQVEAAGTATVKVKLSGKATTSVPWGAKRMLKVTQRRVSGEPETWFVLANLDEGLDLSPLRGPAVRESNASESALIGGTTEIVDLRPTLAFVGRVVGFNPDLTYAPILYAQKVYRRVKPPQSILGLDRHRTKIPFALWDVRSAFVMLRMGAGLNTVPDDVLRWCELPETATGNAIWGQPCLR